MLRNCHQLQHIIERIDASTTTTTFSLRTVNAILTIIIISFTTIIITINNLEVRSQLVSLLGEVVQRGTEHSYL